MVFIVFDVPLAASWLRIPLGQKTFPPRRERPATLPRAHAGPACRHRPDPEKRCASPDRPGSRLRKTNPPPVRSNQTFFILRLAKRQALPPASFTPLIFSFQCCLRRTAAKQDGQATQTNQRAGGWFRYNLDVVNRCPRCSSRIWQGTVRTEVHKAEIQRIGAVCRSQVKGGRFRYNLVNAQISGGQRNSVNEVYTRRAGNVRAIRPNE